MTEWREERLEEKKNVSSNEPGKKAFYQLLARSQCWKWGGAGSKDAGVAASLLSLPEALPWG